VSAGQARLVDATGRNDDDRGLGCAHQGQGPRDGSDPAVEAQLPEECQLVETRGVELTVGGQNRDGDRQVEAGTDLAERRGGEVDGHPPAGPGEPARGHRGPNPVARLAHRCVRQAHHGEHRQSVRHVGFHGNRSTFNADECRRGDRGQHDDLQEWTSG
jgi:hypothetical protein